MIEVQTIEIDGSKGDASDVNNKIFKTWVFDQSMHGRANIAVYA